LVDLLELYDDAWTCKLQKYYATLDIAMPEHVTYIEQFDFGSRSLCVFVSAM